VRNEFVGELVELAGRDARVVLLTADLGFTVLEQFAERYPDRFYNAGVAEQNAVGVATGLADAGFVPFVYSIATFATLRPYEFVRNGPLLHRLPVRLVGVGGGLDYGLNGVTHHALEDVAIMRAQPDMTVIAPADAGQACNALAATADLPGPIYYRIGKEANAVEGLDGRFRLGRAEVIGEPGDVAFVTLGTAARGAVEAAAILRGQGIGACVVVVASVSPPPVDDLIDVLGRVPLAVSAEAHYVTGGVGSLVAEVIAEAGLGTRLVRAGVREMPRGTAGSAAYLAGLHGLLPAQLADAATRSLELSRP
jgi:transketolase